MADKKVDEYIESVIKAGDEGSALLAAICAPTLKREYVEIVSGGMNNVTVARIPQNYLVIAHSTSGDSEVMDPKKYAQSLVERLLEQSKILGSEPIAISNIIDASTIDKNLIEAIGTGLVEESKKSDLAIMNGELAGLGIRVNCPANISGTMIGMIPKTHDLIHSFIWQGWQGDKDGVSYAVFDPEGMGVYMNCDGVGTKTEFYERAGKLGGALRDSAAMKADDTIKLGAVLKVLADVVEKSGGITTSELVKEAQRISQELNVKYILQEEDVGDRLKGYKEGEPTYNVSGTAISVIDEERLRNPLAPKFGDYVIAIRGKPNPRSNGITDKRKIMIDLFGVDWHKTETGKVFLEYLSAPSTVLYPIFTKLINEGLATSVYHMSGGAYNGKFARPLAKHGLFAKIENIFPPDWRELTLAGAQFASAETAYGKWPMGNDGFVTTSNPDEAIKAIENMGLEAKVVGKVGTSEEIIGTLSATGVMITAFNGKTVYFTGRD